MIQYTVNKGINTPIEIKGLKAQYIGFLAVGLVFSFVVFALLYVMGVSMIACLIIAGVLILTVFFCSFHLSTTYGEHGLMKKLAQKQVPRYLTVRNRKIFTNLIIDLDSKDKNTRIPD